MSTADTSDVEVGNISEWASKRIMGLDEETTYRIEKLNAEGPRANLCAKRRGHQNTDSAVPQQSDKSPQNTFAELTKPTKTTKDRQVDTRKPTQDVFEAQWR